MFGRHNLQIAMRRVDETIEDELNPVTDVPSVSSTMIVHEIGRLETYLTALHGEEMRLESSINELTSQHRQTVHLIKVYEAAVAAMRDHLDAGPPST